jgi:hypothetical protein
MNVVISKPCIYGKQDLRVLIYTLIYNLLLLIYEMYFQRKSAATQKYYCGILW